ncbi:MAG: hypothetical protein L6Q71_05625, partial [Planctomycetes bacterium]|nr:hypothetical protein [Planctomycetota bacterium]
MKVQCLTCGRKIKAKRRMIESLPACRGCGASPWQYNVLADDTGAQIAVLPAQGQYHQPSSKPTLYIQSNNLTPYQTPSAPQPPMATPANYYPQNVRRPGSSHSNPAVPGYGVPQQGYIPQQQNSAAPVPQQSYVEPDAGYDPPPAQQPRRMQAKRPTRRPTAAVQQPREEKSSNVAAIIGISSVALLAIIVVVVIATRSSSTPTNTTTVAKQPASPPSSSSQPATQSPPLGTSAPSEKPAATQPEQPVVAQPEQKQPSVTDRYGELREKLKLLIPELQASATTIENQLKDVGAKLKQREASLAAELKRVTEALKNAEAAVTTAIADHKKAAEARNAASNAYDAAKAKFSSPLIDAYIGYEEYRAAAQVYEDLQKKADDAQASFAKIDEEYDNLVFSINKMEAELEAAKFKAENGAALQDKLDARAEAENLAKQLETSKAKRDAIEENHDQLEEQVDVAKKEAAREWPKAKAAKEVFDQLCIDIHGKDAEADKFIAQYAACEKARTDLKKAKDAIVRAKAWKDCVGATSERIEALLGAPTDVEYAVSDDTIYEIWVYNVNGAWRGVTLSVEDNSVEGFCKDNNDSWEDISDPAKLFADEYNAALAAVKPLESQPAVADKAFKATVDKVKPLVAKARKESGANLDALKAQLEEEKKRVEEADRAIMQAKDAAETAKKDAEGPQATQKQLDKVKKVIESQTMVKSITGLAAKVQAFVDNQSIERTHFEDLSQAATEAYGAFQKTVVTAPIPDIE